MSTFNRFRIIFLIGLMLMLPALSPAIAQDATPEVAGPVIQDIATPESVSPVTIINNMEAPAAAPAPPVQPIGGTNGIILVIGAAAMFVLGFGIAVYKGKSPDAALTQKLEEARQNGQVISEIRQAYKDAHEPVKQMVEAIKAVVGVVAPFTPIRADDEFALLLNDITDKDAAKALLLELRAQQSQPPASTG